MRNISAEKKIENLNATYRYPDTCSDVWGAHINFTWNSSIESPGVARSRPQLSKLDRSMRPHGTTLI